MVVVVAVACDCTDAGNGDGAVNDTVSYHHADADEYPVAALLLVLLRVAQPVYKHAHRLIDKPINIHRWRGFCNRHEPLDSRSFKHASTSGVVFETLNPKPQNPAKP